MNRPRILVVEDEKDIRDLIAFTLQHSGFQVYEAANGAQAVEQATALMPDLIIMDIRMPKMTGYQACQVLKAQANTKHIPIVFLSAKDQEEDIRTGLALGAVAYFVKPFDPIAIPKRIKNILENVKSR